MIILTRVVRCRKGKKSLILILAGGVGEEGRNRHKASQCESCFLDCIKNVCVGVHIITGGQR